MSQGLVLPDLANVTGEQLAARVYQLRKEERHRLVELLAYLGEVARRKLWAEMAFSSMFAFLRGYLGYSKASAYRRKTAAELMARFPVVAEYLADGRLGLTTLSMLKDVLCEEGLDEVLGRAAGRTEEQVEELVAALRPRLAPPDLIRRLPGKQAQVPSPAPSTLASTGPELPPEQPSQATTPPRPSVAPVAEATWVMRLAIHGEFKRDLDAARAALSHAIPDGRLEDVLHHGLRLIIADSEKRRRGTGRPARATSSATNNRHVPAPVRNAVWARDGGSCAYVSPEGRRCGSTWQLQVHHIHPAGRGGPSTVANCSLRCRAHNLYQAEKDYGAEVISQARAARQGRLF